MTQQDFLNSVVINIGLLVPCCLMAFVLGMMGARHGQDSPRYLGTAFLSFPVMIAVLIGFSAYARIGSLVDARAAPALLAGVLGGVPAAMSTALVGAAMRYWQGGPFVLAGVMAVMTLCATGVLLRTVFVRQLWTWTRGLALLGMCGAVVTMPSHFIAVPFEMGLESFRDLSPLLTVIDILGVLVLGLSFWAGFSVEKAWQRMSLLQSAISGMKNGVVIAEVEPELKTVFANPAITQISGYELKDVLGEPPYMLLTGLEGQPELARLRRAVDRLEPCQVELLNRRKDGSDYINHLSVSPVTDRSGRVSHVIGIQEDVTAQRESERRIQMMAERLPLSLAMIGSSEDILLVNEEFRNLYGAAPGEAQGRHLKDVIGAKEYTRLRTPLSQAFRGERVEREVSFDSARHGRWVTLRETFLPASTSKTSLQKGCIWIVEDISDQRHAEEELRQSHKMRSIGDLTGGIAHDFNNLNAVVIGNLELLEEAAGPDGVKPFLSEALDAAYRASYLTQSLLSFSRRASLQPCDFKAVDHFDRLKPLLHASVPETIALRINVSPEITGLHLDPASLDNAILNLVLNARDAIEGPKGEICVTAAIDNIDSAAEGEDVAWFAGDLSDVPAGQYFTLSITDNGSGVPDEIRRKMFEPFATTKGVQIGTGLGLAMVHGFVHQSGGLMRVGDRPQGGTIVQLMFPSDVLVHEMNRDLRSDPDTIQLRTDLRAVLVEDETSVRNVLKRRLLGLGFRVTDFATADDAMVYIEAKGPPDLLLTDVVLRGQMQGPELGARIKAIWPSVKVVLASGYPAEYRVDPSAATHDGFLKKPFAQGDFEAVITACFPDFRMSDDHREPGDPERAGWSMAVAGN